MNEINIPVNAVGVGPGSQPQAEDGVEIDILQMPSGMDSYNKPILPEPEEVQDLFKAKESLSQVLSELQNYKIGMPVQKISVMSQDAANLDLIDQVLGEGEVSVIYSGDNSGKITAKIQESVLAGVWRICYSNEQGELIGDDIEVSSIPSLVLEKTF